MHCFSSPFFFFNPFISLFPATTEDKFVFEANPIKWDESKDFYILYKKEVVFYVLTCKSRPPALTCQYLYQSGLLFSFFFYTNVYINVLCLVYIGYILPRSLTSCSNTRLQCFLKYIRAHTHYTQLTKQIGKWQHKKKIT